MHKCSENEELVRGVDVYIGEHRRSRPIPFDKFAKDGIKVCYIGTSEGDLIKKGTDELHDLSQEQNLLTSACHFLTPWTNGKATFYDVEEEFETFMKSIKNFKIDLPLAVDLEHYKAPVSGEQRALACHTFAGLVWKETSIRPIVYTSKRYIRKMFHENIKNEKSKFHGLEIYDLWVADYSGKIDLPFGWKDWIGHQNTDNYMKSFDHNYFKKEWVDKYKQG